MKILKNLFIKPVAIIMIFCSLPAIIGYSDGAIWGMESDGFPDEGMANYENTLPKIALSIDDKTIAIAHFVCAFNVNAEATPEQFDKLCAQIRYCINNNELIQFGIVGFPLKSSNTNSKTITDTFDFAEFVGLFTLDYLCKEISKMHKPGASVTIFSREIQTDYANKIERPKPKKGPISAQQLFPEDRRQDYQTKLCWFVENHFDNLAVARIDESIARQNYDRVAADFNKNVCLEEYMSRKIFWRKDCNRTTSFNLSNAKCEEYGGKIAECMMIGTRAMRKTVDDTICHNDTKNPIMLSMHEDEMAVDRIGFPLIYNLREKRSPWHNVCVFQYSQNGLLMPSLKHKSEICFTSCTVQAWAPRGSNFKLPYVVVEAGT